MKLSAIKKILETSQELNFELPNGTKVPKHFHVTEIGQINKKFIDCGGTIRQESIINFQLWYADDVEHRLAPKKLLDIILLAEKELGMEDMELEVEYQSNTIGKYNLDFKDNHFVLLPKQTNCLALDKCGIPESKAKLNLSELIVKQNTCDPGSGCC